MSVLHSYSNQDIQHGSFVGSAMMTSKFCRIDVIGFQYLNYFDFEFSRSLSSEISKVLV